MIIILLPVIIYIFYIYLYIYIYIYIYINIIFIIVIISIMVIITIIILLYLYSYHKSLLYYYISVDMWIDRRRFRVWGSGSRLPRGHRSAAQAPHTWHSPTTPPFRAKLVPPVSVRRFPSFRTQPLENLSHCLWQKRSMSNPAPGENLVSGNLVMKTGCSTTLPLFEPRCFLRPAAYADIFWSHANNKTCFPCQLFVTHYIYYYYYYYFYYYYYYYA